MFKIVTTVYFSSFEGPHTPRGGERYNKSVNLNDSSLIYLSLICWKNSAKRHIPSNMAPTTTTKTKAVEESVRCCPLAIVTAVEWPLTSRQPQPKETAPPKKLSEMSEVIDKATFDQILEMDDDEDMDFSKGIVYGFFDQAETTFDKMDKAL